MKPKQNAAESLNESTREWLSNINDKLAACMQQGSRVQFMQVCNIWTNTYNMGNNPCYWTLNWFGRWMVMKSLSPKASLSQTWLMSLKGEKIKLNVQRVRRVSHNMESCIFTVAAVSEITALKRRTKYPCITVLKYRPKNPRLYFSEIKPLGLIHIQSLVSSWALGLCNPVLMAVVGKSCFITGQLYDEVLDTVCWADLYLAVCPISSQNQSFLLGL